MESILWTVENHKATCIVGKAHLIPEGRLVEWIICIRMPCLIIQMHLYQGLCFVPVPHDSFPEWLCHAIDGLDGLFVHLLLTSSLINLLVIVYCAVCPKLYRSFYHRSQERSRFLIRRIDL